MSASAAQPPCAQEEFAAAGLAGALVQHGPLDYETARSIQYRLVEDRLSGQRPDTLLLLEHEPVFTIGRTARAEHWGGDERAPHVAGIPVVRVERGGSVTYHGPGQLVGYPILKLHRFCPGPRAYVRMLEEVIIRTPVIISLRSETKLSFSCVV